MTVSAAEVRALIASGESRTVECKATLHDLRTNNGKGEFVRDVLALANCTQPNVPGHLLLGVQDPARGGVIVGLEKPLDQNQLSQILSAYTEPIPDVHVENVEMDGHTIGVLTVLWSEHFPYFASRDCGSTLLADIGYTRRDGVVGRLRQREIEYLLRARADRLGPLVIREPLQCGFVVTGKWTGPNGPILRVVNVSDTLVRDVEVIFDLRSSMDTAVFRRTRAWGPVPLEAGASREYELSLRTAYLSRADGRRVSDDDPTQRWLDVLAHIQFRDQFGFLRELQAQTLLLD